VRLDEAEMVAKSCERGCWKSLGEDVGNLICGWNVDEVDVACFDVGSDEMVGNMLSSTVIARVDGEFHGGLVILEDDDCWLRIEIA